MSPAMIAEQEKQKQLKAAKEDKPSIPGLPPAAATTVTKAAKKKKKKSGNTDGSVKETTTKLAGFTIEEPNFSAPAPGPEKKKSAEPKNEAKNINVSVAVASGAPSSATDPAKKLKNLKKKLRDTELLEEKIKSGELKNPDKDQLEKIKRKQEVIKEIKDLEKIVK